MRASASPCPPQLLVSCAVCERLHEPARSDASHPVCVPCARDRLPAGFVPMPFAGLRDRRSLR